MDQPSAKNTIDFITIASTGNATDFGDSILDQTSGGAVTNIRAVFGGGYDNSHQIIGNIIEFVTIATTGNGADFGDLFQINAGANTCRLHLTVTEV